MGYRDTVSKTLPNIIFIAMTLSRLAHAADAEPSNQTAESGSLEEITVTARRQAENLQIVPVTVSVVNADTLAFRGGNIDDLTQLVTGLENNAYSDRNNISFAIRGQQQSYGTLYPAVVTYFSEMPLSRVSDGQTFDIDSVQVLKGPQGTLFGRLTDGGAILLNPKKPTNDFEGYAEVKVGNYDQREYLGAINIPIVSDDLMVRVAFDVNRRDGFTYNQFNDTRLDNVSYESGRIGVTWKITDQIENYAVANYNHSFTNGTATTLLQVNPIALASAGFGNSIVPFQDALSRQNVLGPRTVDIGYSGPLNAGNPNASDGIYYERNVLWVVDTTTWHAADNFTLKSILGYVYNKEIENDDADGSSVDYLQSLSTIPETVGQDSYYEQYTAEIQALGKVFDNKLSYTVGGYADYKHPPGPTELYGFLYDSIQYATASPSQLHSDAVYGQGGYDLSDLLEGLKVDFGGRYTNSRVTTSGFTYYAFNADPSSLPHAGQCLTDLSAYPNAYLASPCQSGSAESKTFTYTLGLDYQISPGIFTYFSLRRGARQGGINLGAATYDPKNPTYKPEFDLSHEVGIKAEWSIGNVQVRSNLAAFYDDYTDIQTYLYVTAPGGALFTTVHNAAQATIKGVEADVEVVPVTHLSITGSWAYTEAAYSTTNYTGAQLSAACPANPLVTAPDLSLICPLNPLPNVPKSTLRVATHYTLPLSDIGAITLGGDMYHTASRFTGGDVDVASGTIPAYTLYNLDATWKGFFRTPLDVSLFVNNVANKVYLESLDDEISNGDTGVTKGFYGPPRMYGVSLRYSFGK